jgi:Icc protein
MTAPLTLVQITDTHLLDHPDDLLRGCNPWRSLQGVLEQVAQHNPDGLLLTGDLADQGSAVAYGRLLKAVCEFDCPIYWLPGNHDNPSILQQTFLAPRCHGPQAIDLGTWRLLLLNSVLPDAKFGEGYLASDQLRWLHRELTQSADRPTAIALHHHPVPTAIDWLDQIPVQNGDDLLTVLESFPQVHLVLFGHIHHALQYRWKNPRGESLEFLGCPSTCVQVEPPVATPDHHLPGFRLIQLYDDGHYRTQVQRVQPARVA